MKRIIGGLAALAFVLTLGSCGGPSEADIVGTWKVDASSIDVTLGDGVPAELKTMVEAGKAEMMREGKAEIEAASIEFKEGGKLVITMDGNSEEGTWKLDGDNMIISMKEGKGSIALAVEMDGDSMKLTLTAEELLNAIKKEEPRAVDQIEQMSGGKDVEKMIEGTSMSVTLKK